ESWKNHTIKAHLKTTGDTYMKHHRNSYEVSVDQAVLLNDAEHRQAHADVQDRQHRAIAGPTQGALRPRLGRQVY
ncbi:hypothetical protein PF010_g31955, partial [Phytophthora fragariae]